MEPSTLPRKIGPRMKSRAQKPRGELSKIHGARDWAFPIDQVDESGIGRSVKRCEIVRITWPVASDT